MKLRTALILIIGILGGFQAYGVSRVYWEASVAPSRSEFRASVDPAVRIKAAISGKQVGQLILESAKGQESDARAALRRNPLNAEALAVLAITSENPIGGSLLMRAEQVTRRSDFVQLVALDQAAKNQDLDAALSHIDRLLTIYPDTQATIFPALAGVLTHPQAIDLLIRRQSRSWFVPFVGFALSNSNELVNLIALAEKASQASSPDDNLLRAVVARLTKEGAVREAQAFASNYAHISPSVFSDFALTVNTLDQRLVPLTWRTASDVAASDLTNLKPSLEFSIPPLRTINLLDRQTQLAWGTYVLEQDVSSRSGSPPSSVMWSMTCIGQTQSVWQQEVPVTSTQTRFRSIVKIPQGCSGQAWKLWASGENLQVSSTLILEDLRLLRSERDATDW